MKLFHKVCVLFRCGNTIPLRMLMYKVQAMLVEGVPNVVGRDPVFDLESGVQGGESIGRMHAYEGMLNVDVAINDG